VCAGPRRLYRFSSVLSMPVKNLAEENVGTIDEVVFEAVTGCVAYVVLSLEEFVQTGGRRVGVPWKWLSLRQDDHGQYAMLLIDPEKLRSSAIRYTEHWQDGSDPAWSATVDAHFNRGAEANAGG